MKVLLLQPAPPSYKLGDSIAIGLIYIASFLRKHNIDARVLDLSKNKIDPDFIPDLVGIGASTPYYKNALLAISNTRKIFPKAKIILGGDHVTALPQEGLSYADFVVKGEGELAMLSLCKGHNPDTKIIEGPMLDNIDDIPIPDIDLMDCVYKGRKKRLHFIGSRGCPFDCVFCGEHTRKIRYNSVSYFIENLKIISKRYGNNIFITDDVFTIDKNRVFEICEKIIKENLKISLEVFGHINCFDASILPVMKRAGIGTISYGIESGNDHVLTLIKKKFTTEQAKEVIAKTSENGLEVKCLYMIGNIGETEETVNDTVEFALKASKKRWCSFALPFPGSMFYDLADKYGKVLTKDWNKYTNQNIVYLPEGLSRRFMQSSRDRIVGFSDRSMRGKVRAFLGAN